MLKASDSYKVAITGDVRRILLKTVVNIIDPDLTWGEGSSSGAESFSDLTQLRDKVLEQDSRYITLEQNRWLLDGSFVPLDEYEMGNAAFTSTALSGADGTFDTPQWCQITFSNVDILQACSIYFPDNDYDGVPCDFTVDIYQGGTSYHTETVTDNTDNYVDIKHFTVYYPDTIKITVTRWSLPYRRCRIPEIIPGVYETWTGDMIASFDIQQQANIACTSLPYGSCTLKMDNLDRRFEPRSKDGVFQSIEARQGIDVNIGVELEDGNVDYKHVGTYYQYNGGWTTGDNGITMEWYLVDIIGLLADRQYIPPDTLPTTLDGWIQSIAAQLGTNFGERYHVDPDYADTALTCQADDVAEIKCGDLLRYVCMASGTWPRADNSTGYLTAEPLWNEGNKLTLDNMEAYPVMKANDDVAYVTFYLYNEYTGSETETYIISGNSQAASATVEVKNPFLHTKAQALAAARLILATMGGNELDTTGRGDMVSEIGDVDTVWLNESSATTGRRVSQAFTFNNGVLQGCDSTLLQADGSFLWQNRVKFTEDTTWTVPDGVTQIRMILVGHGYDGTAGTLPTASLRITYDLGAGQSGYEVTEEYGSTVAIPPEVYQYITKIETFNCYSGTMGYDGSGGKIYAETINVNAGMTIPIHIGKKTSDPTTAYSFSTENGKFYTYGYTDISNGDSYGRSGVAEPLSGSGDGGRGASGYSVSSSSPYQSIPLDDNTVAYTKTNVPVNVDGEKKYVISVGPSSSLGYNPSSNGATGCVVIYWADPDAELSEGVT
jgi:hypothetical protein